ncbi:protein of unknown function [Paenibacillus alvei]|uniref:Uncharacterized protein n=1 Tax=Paenibacillus alvei TaxID=44250 RepID=A0A383RFE2_PAEAL|nr:protein of unknown function [Paenibacillus alvei]
MDGNPSFSLSQEEPLNITNTYDSYAGTGDKFLLPVVYFAACS